MVTKKVLKNIIKEFLDVYKKEDFYKCLRILRSELKPFNILVVESFKGLELCKTFPYKYLGFIDTFNNKIYV